MVSALVYAGSTTWRRRGFGSAIAAAAVCILAAVEYAVLFLLSFLWQPRLFLLFPVFLTSEVFAFIVHMFAP